jgi:hypothetical protein
MRQMSDFPPQFWRNRAEEARARADEMFDPVAKGTMEIIADAYDGLAERAQTRLLGRTTPLPRPN